MLYQYAEPITAVQCEGHVKFDSLPDSTHWKAVESMFNGWNMSESVKLLKLVGCKRRFQSGNRHLIKLRGKGADAVKG